MYAAQGLLVRTSIVLGMVAAVVTILYFTPMPEQQYMSCDRPCHDLDWPMICRTKITIESRQNIGSECDFHNCTVSQEASRGVLVANRQFPGPAIQICQNDILVVDVINKIPGQSVTVHWRGQPQNESPTMDGVPMVTQCPVSSYTTFQYKFRASSPGTHLWHAHAGSEIVDGIFGALIVRQPRKVDPQRKLYDVDDRTHVMVVSEWGEDSSTNRDAVKLVLINGKSVAEPEVFKVKKGKRYRFRAAYSGGPSGCPITLSLDQHLLKVMAVDGNPINPYEVSSVTLSKGERVDFVLKTNQGLDRYIFKAVSECGPEGRALVEYGGVSGERTSAESKGKVEAALSGTRKLDTGFCESKIGQVCISDVRSLMKMPRQLSGEEVDKRVYFGYDYKIPEQDSDSQAAPRKFYAMNNISFTYPSSPLLTQREDVPETNICNSLNKPEQCQNEEICECVHVEQIPLGASVELVLVDQGGDSRETVFHLHGYRFYVVGYRNFSKPISVEEAKRLNEGRHLFKRNFGSPVLKDTVRVPRFAVVAVRFIANNPGYWMLRDENSKKWSRGLDVVLQVGDSCDMPAKPSNFPTCGSWVGPEFFLS